ncbi:Ecdysteroid kinase-domain-containing protein [Biscogniauxia sp. FL1348]|nr:Ecdysteroid kinase-domain-containing protein [Biscogniauxia sp. FL1348]
MAPPTKAEQVASIMLSWHSLELVSCQPLQSLWAGYGQICSITARATHPQAAAQARLLCGMDTNTSTDTTTFSLILKLIDPPTTDSDEGHLRKMLSYEVEQYFYAAIAPRLPSSCPMARCLCTTRDRPVLRPGLVATLMTDLRAAFPVPGSRRAPEVRAALSWLAAFHRGSRAVLPAAADVHHLVRPPLEEKRRARARVDGVWLNGGYTYLATRRGELAALEREGSGSEWSRALCGGGGRGECVAEVVAAVLAPRQEGLVAGQRHLSLIHGDVKSENLFATADGGAVAFYDFQYVGLGLGVCDLAKLFTCSVPRRMLMHGDEEEEGGAMELPMGEREKALLERYREGLLAGGDWEYEWPLFVRHWETALVDWLRFQASWGFWGNTEWLEARVRSILKDEGWRTWLYEQHAAIRRDREPETELSN